MPKKRKLSKVTIKQINIARTLLDMMYMPAELAREFSVDEQIIYEWIKQGLPHEKDNNKMLWIHGIKAGEWILALRKGAA